MKLFQEEERIVCFKFTNFVLESSIKSLCFSPGDLGT